MYRGYALDLDRITTLRERIFCRGGDVINVDRVLACFAAARDKRYSSRLYIGELNPSPSTHCFSRACAVLPRTSLLALTARSRPPINAGHPLAPLEHR